MSEELRLVIAGVRAGDRQAMVEFVGRFAGHFRSLARQGIRRWRLDGHVEADEVLNAAMLELCRRSEQLAAREPPELLRYLECVIRSLVNEAGRRRRSHKRGGGQVRDAATDGGELADPRSRSTEEVELEEAIGRAYDQLSGDERLIALLRRGGASWEEIAQRMATSPDAARKRGERAVERLSRNWR